MVHNKFKLIDSIFEIPSGYLGVYILEINESGVQEERSKQVAHVELISLLIVELWEEKTILGRVNSKIKKEEGERNLGKVNVESGGLISHSVESSNWFEEA
jgi:hypothetical protein